MLHRDEATNPGQGSAHRRLERDLLVDAPLRVDAVYLGGRLDDLGRRRARVAASEARPGAHGSVGDGFVTGIEKGSLHGAPIIASGHSAASRPTPTPPSQPVLEGDDAALQNSSACTALPPAEPGPHGRALSRPPHRRRSQALLRSRFRTLLFPLLAVLACAIGHPAAAAPAVLGVLIGLLSGAVARRQGQRLALSFAVLDWLLLGCVLALAGGVHSWLLGAVPILTAGQLGVSPHHDWPYLLAPASLLVIVLAIADPSLGGNKTVSVAVFLLLVAGGVAAAYRIDPSRARRARPARIDAVTGFHTAQRLREVAAPRLQVAAAEQQPLSLVYVQLEHLRGQPWLPRRPWRRGAHQGRGPAPAQPARAR